VFTKKFNITIKRDSLASMPTLNKTKGNSEIKMGARENRK